MTNRFTEEIKALLDAGHDASIRDRIVSYVGDDTEKMAVLMTFFLDQTYHWRYNQRAAWPVSKIAEQRPDLVQPYIGNMMAASREARHDAVKRNTVRILQFVPIPEELEGVVFDLCYTWLNDPAEPVAIRVFSMTVLTSIAEKYPEMADELRSCILLHYDNGTAGFQSRARKTLKRLDSISS